MADLTITGTVKVVSGTPPVLLAGEDLGQGVPFYLDDAVTPNVIRKADANVLATSRVNGITVAEALSGQYIPVIQGGQIDLGTTVIVLCKQYVLSHTTGKIKPIEDLASGEYVTYLFFSDTATPTLNIRSWGVAVP